MLWSRNVLERRKDEKPYMENVLFFKLNCRQMVIIKYFFVLLSVLLFLGGLFFFLMNYQGVCELTVYLKQANNENVYYSEFIVPQCSSLVFTVCAEAKEEISLQKIIDSSEIILYNTATDTKYAPTKKGGTKESLNISLEYLAYGSEMGEANVIHPGNYILLFISDDNNLVKYNSENIPVRILIFLKKKNAIKWFHLQKVTVKNLTAPNDCQ